MTESNDEPVKRPNLENHLDAMDNAIDLLMAECSAERSLDDAIAQSTTALTRLKEKSIPLLIMRVNALLLIMRANALAKQAQFTRAMEDVVKAIERQPKAVEGYLAAANIYSMQGKEQAAIAILESGLDAVSSSEQPLLFDRQNAARDLLYRRVDFVARLPVEIASAIFEHLQSEDEDEDDSTLVECACVSKQWREIVLEQCADAWRTVTFDSGYLSPAAVLLPVISKHIRKLTIRRFTLENALVKRLIAMAAYDKFPAISTFTIMTSTTLLAQFHVVLITLFRFSLTRVNIDIPEFGRDADSENSLAPASLAFNLILSLCPNLQHLIFKTEYEITYNPLQPSVPGGYELITLAIVSLQSHGLLEQLLPFCPKLQVLLTNALSPSTITLIHQLLPRLRCLRILDDDRLELNTISSNADGHPGLYYLECGITSADQLQSTMLLLMASKRTLKALKLFVDYPESIAGSNQLAELSFDVLKDLDLLVRSHTSYFSDNIAYSIIRQCPLLETVTLNFSEKSAVFDGFYNCLVVQPQLRFVDISEVNSPSVGLMLLLNKLSERGETCMLQEITLGGEAVTDGVLSALTDIATLQKITLRECPVVTTHGVEEFYRRLLTLPFLTGVTLEDNFRSLLRQ